MLKIKVLAISSDPVMLRFLQHNLNDGHYQLVNTQHTGEELEAVLDKELPGFIILDIMMPNLGGIEICLRLRQWFQVPILMLSAWGAGEGKVRGLDLIADSYLTEPFGIDEVLKRMNKALQRNIAALNLSSHIRSGVS